MTEKCQSYFLQNHLNKSTWKINIYFSIITQIWNTSKAELVVNCNKSKCIQIEVHFHFALTLNAIALRWPTLVSRATCGSLPSFMRLLRNYIPDVPLNNMHNNKCLVKFCYCHVGGTINLVTKITVFPNHLKKSTQKWVQTQTGPTNAFTHQAHNFVTIWS